MQNKKPILHVTKRTELGKNASRRFRRNGLIPAILYGHSAQNENILVSYKEWSKLENKEFTLLDLQIDSEPPVTVLIKDIQTLQLKGEVIHFDFFRVKMDEEITATVSVHAVGTAEGASHGGMLEQIIHEIEVSCLPADLPEHIDVDISGLDIDEAVYVKDLRVSDKIKIHTDPEQIVFHVVKESVSDEGEEETAAEGEGEAEATEKKEETGDKESDKKG